MSKYELLRLLDEPEVKSKILKIVEASQKVSPPEENFPSPIDERRLEILRGENLRLQQRVKELEAEKNSALKRVTTAERQLEILRGENLRLKNSQQDAAEFKRALDAAQEKISEQEAQLQQRFADGWELYQKYCRVGAHARQLLQGVFVRDNFTSFICGGAQVDSLEKIWDVLRECVMSSRKQDAEILWAVFEYCLELVNSSKAQASYSILPVKVGERFDSEIHSEAPGSRAQGKISAVYLPGFQNEYSGRIIKKSIVQVS